MSYYNELNKLYMEKVAARSYGRNPDGSRRTVEQLIEQLGGSDYHPRLNGTSKLQRDGKTKVKVVRTYIDPRKSSLPIEVPTYYLTGDGKYNYSVTSRKRFELGKELLKSKRYPEKVVRQHAEHENRLSIPTPRSFDTIKDNRDTYSNNSKWSNGKFVSTHNKPGPENKAAAKQYRARDKEMIKDMNRKFKRKYSSKAPYAILATGLLAAGAIETKNLYDKMKVKREAENKDKIKKTEPTNV